MGTGKIITELQFSMVGLDEVQTKLYSKVPTGRFCLRRGLQRTTPYKVLKEHFWVGDMV